MIFQVFPGCHVLFIPFGWWRQLRSSTFGIGSVTTGSLLIWLRFAMLSCQHLPGREIEATPPFLWFFLSSQEKIRGTMKNKADWWQWTWNDLNKDCDSKLTNLRLADYRMYSTPEADREEEEEDAEARAKQARCRTGNIHSRAIQAVWMSLGSAWGHAWDDCHQEFCRCQWCLYMSIELSAIVQFQTEIGRGIAVCKCGCQT